MGSEDDDDDVPLVPPEIQRNYEAALGRFMLTFNQLDNLVGKIPGAVLKRPGREDLLRSCVEDADFGLRLRFLDLLKHSTEGQGLVNVPMAEMRGIAGQRNILAHGHFDQKTVRRQLQASRSRPR